ncbi:MAG: tail fiber domain-containing protein, partial [Patescibacteria group bacterium]
TMYIDGAPAAGTNVTITNGYSLFVNTGFSIFGGGLATGAGLGSNANAYIGGGTSLTTSSNAPILFAGAGTAQFRSVFTGSVTQTLTAGVSESNIIVGKQLLTTAATGTHALLANMVVNPLGTVTSGGAAITNTASLYVDGASTAGTNNYAFWVASGLSQFGSASVTTGTTVATFQNAGGTCSIVPSTSGGVTCSSDMYLKKNITALADGSSWSFNNNVTTENGTVLEKIMALKPVDYNWNVEKDADVKHAGFIAQEVQQIFPDLVSEDPKTHLLSLNYTGMMPYAIQAIQEMNMTLKAIPTFEDPTMTQNISAFLSGIAERGEAVVKLVTAKKVKTQELCLGDDADSVCVTKDQLKALLHNQGAASAVPPTPAPSPQPEAEPEPVVEPETPAVEIPAVTPEPDPAPQLEAPAPVPEAPVSETSAE